MVFRNIVGIVNIFEAFSQSVGTVAKVYRIRWLLDLGRSLDWGRWSTGKIAQVEQGSRGVDNNLFEVNDLEETSVKFDVGVDVDDDKFNVGVDVNDDDTVEGVNAARAAVRERFDFLSPIPDE